MMDSICIKDKCVRQAWPRVAENAALGQVGVFFSIGACLVPSYELRIDVSSCAVVAPGGIVIGGDRIS